MDPVMLDIKKFLSHFPQVLGHPIFSTLEECPQFNEAELRQVQVAAFYAAQPFTNRETAISVDVGIPSMGYAPSAPVEGDDWSALAGAILSRRSWIWASVAGQVDFIEALTWKE